MRDYVTIMKAIFAREEPVTHDGMEISLPYTGKGAAGILGTYMNSSFIV